MKLYVGVLVLAFMFASRFPVCKRRSVSVDSTLCSKRNAETAMDHTQTFRGQYGRLCTLVAQALIVGHSKDSVLEAACGNGDSVIPVYVRLREQRRRSNAALGLCKAAGVSNDELIQRAREIRTAVEQEWDRRIPIMDPRRLSV